MVDDYLSDREQEEALRAWWRDNWRWILGGVVLGIALLFGYFRWQEYRENRGVAASKEFAALSTAFEARNLEASQQALGDLVKDHNSSPYAQQGRLLVAKLNVDAGNYDDAVTLLREVIDNSKDDELASIAQLRLARVLIQQGKQDEALALLKVEDLGALAPTAREIRGDAYVAKGDANAARGEYAAALAGDDAQIDRTVLELKLQEVGGTAAATPGADAQEQP